MGLLSPLLGCGDITFITMLAQHWNIKVLVSWVTSCLELKLVLIDPLSIHSAGWFYVNPDLLYTCEWQ